MTGIIFGFDGVLRRGLGGIALGGEHDLPVGRLELHAELAREPQIIPGRRIGVDTGAYATGLLTAVRLDDGGARILQARAVR